MQNVQKGNLAGRKAGKQGKSSFKLGTPAHQGFPGSETGREGERHAAPLPKY